MGKSHTCTELKKLETKVYPLANAISMTFMRWNHLQGPQSENGSLWCVYLLEKNQILNTRFSETLMKEREKHTTQPVLGIHLQTVASLWQDEVTTPVPSPGSLCSSTLNPEPNTNATYTFAHSVPPAWDDLPNPVHLKTQGGPSSRASLCA